MALVHVAASGDAVVAQPSVVTCIIISGGAVAGSVSIFNGATQAGGVLKIKVPTVVGQPFAIPLKGTYFSAISVTLANVTDLSLEIE